MEVAGPSSGSRSPQTAIPGDVAAPRREWSALRGAALAVIALRLRILSDFLAFGRVCRSWRQVAESNLGAFLGSLPPFLLWDWCNRGLLCHTERMIYCSEELGRKWPAKSRFVGSSHGHLILVCEQRPWVFNPFTGAEISGFPRCEPHVIRAVLSRPPTSPDFALVLFGRGMVRYARRQDANWCWLYGSGRQEKMWSVLDGAVVGATGYVLFTGGKLASFDVVPTGPRNRNLTILEYEATPSKEWKELVDGNNALIEFKGELFAYTASFPVGSPMQFRIFQFDADRRMWRKQESLGERVLFVGRRRAADLFVDNYAKWGGHGNTVYFLDANVGGSPCLRVTEIRVDENVAEVVCSHFCERKDNFDIREVWVTPSC